MALIIIESREHEELARSFKDHDPDVRLDFRPLTKRSYLNGSDFQGAELIVHLQENADPAYIRKITAAARRKPDIVFLLLTGQESSVAQNSKHISNFIVTEFAGGKNETDRLQYALELARPFIKKNKQKEQDNLELQQLISELNSIGIALSSEKNLDKLLGMILTELRRFTNADAGSLYIRDEEKVVFTIAQNDSIDKKTLRELNRKTHSLDISTSSISGYVATTKKPLNIKNVRELPSNSPFQHDRSFDKKLGYETRSILAVPLLDASDELTGVIQLINALDENGNIIPFSQTLESFVASLASQAAVSINNAKLIKEQNILLDSMVKYSASLMDARSRHTAGHSERVAEVVVEIAKAINRSNKNPFKGIYFDDDIMRELKYAALLHDIGKIGVPESVLDKSSRLDANRMNLLKWKLRYIANLLKTALAENKTVKFGKKKVTPNNIDKYLALLNDLWDTVTNINNEELLHDEAEEFFNSLIGEEIEIDGEHFKLLDDSEVESLITKKGNLTREERKIINNHINLTIDILNTIPFPKHLSNVPTFAAQHHERLNGSGYPSGLNAEDIPLQSRILAIADFIDALSAKDRPYREGLTLTKTLEILELEVEKGLYDKDIVELITKEIKTDRLQIPWYDKN